MYLDHLHVIELLIRLDLGLPPSVFYLFLLWSIQNHLCTVSSSLVTALYYPKLVRSLFEKSILAKMSIFSPLCQFCPDIKSVYTHLSPTLPRSHMTLHSCFARLRDTLKNEMLGVQLVYFLGNYYNKGLLDEVYKESKGLVYFYVWKMKTVLLSFLLSMLIINVYTI